MTTRSNRVPTRTTSTSTATMSIVAAQNDVVAIDRPEPVPEMSLDVRVGPKGTKRGRVYARGKWAMVALMVLFVVSGAVVIVRGLRTSPPEPPRHVLDRCTEHIERTPHTEYIERTCSP